MEKNVRWKHPDGAGGFTELNLPSSAEIVAYGAGTVKEELDNLSATTGVSAFMRRLLRANDATEARALLNVAREDFFDEAGNRWNSINAYLSTDAKKFGSRSMHTNGNGYLILPTPFALGGKDFAVAFWFNPTPKSATSTFFYWGNTSSSVNIQILVQLTAKNYFRFLDAHTGTKLGEYVATTAISTDWHHVELDYQQSSNTMYVFLDGVNVLSYNAATSCGTATYNTFILGAAKNGTAYTTGYIDEFFVTEKLLHTAGFTPPTAPCDLDGNTLALLHFDFDTLEYFTDDSGGYCLNLNAALSSTQKKFGSKSAYFNGTSAYLQPATGFSLGGKDCAIAFWIKSPLKSVANTCFCWSDPSANTNLLVQVTAKNFIRFLDVVAGTVLGQYVGTTAISADWHHVELDYQHSSKTMYCFFDGSKVLNYDATKSFGTAFVQVLNLGSAKNGTSPYVGYIDEFLITEKLLHTANFTPPSAPYDLDSDTLALLHFE